jgi:2-phosphosulfolactate phosphatase
MIEVCLSPELISLFDCQGKAVVIVDIFRATSTMVTALAEGIPELIAVAEVAECRAYGEKGYLMAGERQGDKLPGFDLGNSPAALQRLTEKKALCMTTTNGTRALHLSQDAAKIYIGSFLNLSALAKKLQAQERDVLIFCAGWRGHFNMEDSLFAGALLAKTGLPFESDAAKMTLDLYEKAKEDLDDFLRDSSHYQRLLRKGAEEDLAFCLKEDVYDIVPEAWGDKIVLSA